MNSGLIVAVSIFRNFKCKLPLSSTTVISIVKNNKWCCNSTCSIKISTVGHMWRKVETTNKNKQAICCQAAGEPQWGIRKGQSSWAQQHKMARNKTFMLKNMLNYGFIFCKRKLKDKIYLGCNLKCDSPAVTRSMSFAPPIIVRQYNYHNHIKIAIWKICNPNRIFCFPVQCLSSLVIPTAPLCMYLIYNHVLCIHSFNLIYGSSQHWLFCGTKK